MPRNSSNYPKVTDEILALVPEKYRSQCGVNWSEKSQRFYVFLRKGYKYDPERKRTIDLREALGSIRDNVFSFSPSFLKNRKIKDLEDQVDTLKTRTAARELGLTAEQVKASRKLVKEIPDPRQQAKIQFPLPLILAVSFLASLSGHSSAVSIAVYWKKYRGVLEELFAGFPQADISHDTVNRVFRLIKGDHLTRILEKCAAGLMRQVGNRLLHIDGQAVRASKTDSSAQGRYTFNVYDSTNELVLTHLLINEKANEITHCGELVGALDLRAGDIITGDALNTQTKLVDALPGGVHYCLALKENNELLFEEVRFLFARQTDANVPAFSENDAGHGRVEQRNVRVLPASLLSEEHRKKWKNLSDGCLVEVECITEAKSPRARNSADTRHFISSCRFDMPECEKYLATVVRRHWSIENNLHWQLDVSFQQDRIQCTDENYLLNRVALNKIAFNVLKSAQGRLTEQKKTKYSMKTMQQLCADPAGALEIIAMTDALQSLDSEGSD